MRSFAYWLMFGVVAAAALSRAAFFLLHFQISGAFLTYLSLLDAFSEPLPLQLFSIYPSGMLSSMPALLRWLLFILVVNRAFRIIRDRKLEAPFSFRHVSFFVGTVGTISLCIAVAGFFVGTVIPSIGILLGWLGVFGIVLASATLPLAFSIAELHSLKSYAART